MIAAIEWVPAGVAKKQPIKYELNDAEKEALETLKAEHEKDEKKSVSPRQTSGKDDHGLPADLRMDEYSDDEDNDGEIGNILLASEEDKMEEQEVEEQRVVDDHDDQDDDSDEDDNLEDVPDTREYVPVDVGALEAMGLGDGGLPMPHDYLEDDESEAQDVMISPDDALMVVAKTEDDFASLEVHVYDTKNGNLYVHHDIPLPSFPLCLAHGQNVGGASPSSQNFCAVGTFDPGIEIWNLDVINALEPTCVLGGQQNPTASKSGQTKLKKESHTGAVMGLSWNQVHRHVIASGSADHTVKIWDVTSDKNANAGTFTHHHDKVQSVQWHPKEATILATGAYDRTVALLDARDSAKQSIKSVSIPADCESLNWDPFRPECLTAACEDGTVLTWDVRKFADKKPLWSFVASEFGISDISYNRHVPGLMAAASPDRTVSLWDVHNQSSTSPESGITPRNCGSKDMHAGKLYTVSFYPSSPWLLSCGGSENQLALWDMSSEDGIWQQFANRVDRTQPHWADFTLSTGEEGIDATTSGDSAKQQEQPKSNKSKKKKGKGKKKKVHRRGA
ncbi:periodic tryptophan protein [Seminavis robusta]|uniref:Periodic tryptophan protein n=1 Tax=Seminavis robusta TaxID=568900 RepID=A0A9N8EDL2_9STRA|nr:periodic tryptophan protein [Seminavis robusta]|eukprot:Sro841_g209560.1 periodic tryptophan protein (563) ;mRNA; f:26863-28774